MNPVALPSVLDPTMVASEPARSTSLYANPLESTVPFRVVLVAPQRLPGWLLRFLELVTENRWLELVVLPFTGESLPPMQPAPADIRALLAYERSRRREGADTGAGDSPAGVVYGSPIASDLAIAAVRHTVAGLRPDLVLLFGAPHWAEALGDRAQWGCWEFGDSLADAGHAAHALLAPVMRGESATPVELRLQHLDRPPSVLVASCGSTGRTSIRNQCERVFLKMPALLTRALRRLANGDLQVPAQRTSRLQLACSEAPLGWGAGVRTLARALAFRLAARWPGYQPDGLAWHVLLRRGRGLLDPDAPAADGYASLRPPGDRFWADPCAVRDGERHVLFVEQWTDRDPKGVIACLELLADGQVRPLGVVLEREFHLSYPQAFRWQDDWYLSVESGADKCVCLYRATDFPHRWQLAARLLNGWNCVDPTLHHHHDRWYLFVNVAESGGAASDELFLFVADNLLGPFRPHPANPIVSDVRMARPAGRLFERDGRLIRPAQDCGPRYGTAVVFNEVLELSPTHYQERPLGRLTAHWGTRIDGCHTYNATDDIEVIDARGTPDAGAPRVNVLDPVSGSASPVASSRA